MCFPVDFEEISFLQNRPGRLLLKTLVVYISSLNIPRLTLTHLRGYSFIHPVFITAICLKFELTVNRRASPPIKMFYTTLCLQNVMKGCIKY